MRSGVCKLPRCSHFTKEEHPIGSTQRSTYDTSQLQKSVVVLRKVDFDAMDDATIEIIGRAQLAFRYPESNLLWFAEGYVLNDQPRLSDVSREIIEATEHFAVGRTDNQTIMADNLTIREAERAVAGATIKLNLDVQVDLPEIDKPKSASGKAKARAMAASQPDEIDGMLVDATA